MSLKGQIVSVVVYVVSVLVAYWLGHVQGWTKAGRKMRPSGDRPG
jgi:hypothetical protein